MKIRVRNKEEFTKAVSLFGVSGLSLYAGKSSDEYYDYYKLSGELLVGISDTNKYLTSWSMTYPGAYGFPTLSDTSDILEITKNLLEISSIVIIENVGDYSAAVSDEGIQVGCQKISFEKFHEIAAAVAKKGK